MNTTPTQKTLEVPSAMDISQPMVFCPRCRVQIRETDHYCYNCGKSLKRGYGFLYTHTGIILMTLVLGPFALPCVWLSRRISLLSKIIYTLVMIALGYYLVAVCIQMYYSLQDAMKNLTNLQNFSNMQGFSTIDLNSF